MFKNILDYQHQYFQKLYNTNEFKGGFFTESNDLEYINGNSIIVTEVTSETVASVCHLLTFCPNIVKVQFPTGVIDVYDELDCLRLIEYKHNGSELSVEIDIELVTKDNYSQFISLSNQLQIQEYDAIYKKDANENYLSQAEYQMYMVKYKDKYVGEFIYVEKLQAVESIIILSEYQRRGIMRNCFELITTRLAPTIYLSADNSSIEFYNKLDVKVLDELTVNNIYGNSRNVLMYLTLGI